MSNVAARFKVAEIKHVDVGNGGSCAQFKFSAVYNDGKGNESWSKYTPQGEITMTITNPIAIEYFKLGKTYQVEFNEID
jgi:hypothetical protein